MSAPTHSALQKIEDLEESSSDYPDDLDKILHESEYEQCVAGLAKNDQIWLINFLDTALGHLDDSHPASRKCLRELKTCCRIYKILPESYQDVNGRLTVTYQSYACSGGVGDIHKGDLDGVPVCVKRLRISTQEDRARVIRDSYGHAAIWKHLKHPNILRFLHISAPTDRPLEFVSPWITGGTLRDYLQGHSDANRLNLILDVAKGLNYLHSRAVIHGDLKGPNILVDPVGPHAYLADFDVTAVTENPDSTRVYTQQNSSSAPWSSPEVLQGGAPSRAADVYSFAMVMIEVCIKGIPFGNKTGLVIGGEVVKGERHERPGDPFCTEALWLLIEDCWSQDPQRRPETSKVLERLARVREIGVVQS